MMKSQKKRFLIPICHWATCTKVQLLWVTWRSTQKLWRAQ
nr:MAG TPA: hypothetical protein [Caudoviricetes sp.]